MAFHKNNILSSHVKQSPWPWIHNKLYLLQQKWNCLVFNFIVEKYFTHSLCSLVKYSVTILYLVKEKNSSQKILLAQCQPAVSQKSVDCWLTVLITFQTKVLPDSWWPVNNLSVGRKLKLCIHLLTNCLYNYIKEVKSFQ